MIIDWISVTIKLKKKTMIHVLSELKAYFAAYGLEWVEIATGRNGYDHAAKVGGFIWVLWRPDRCDMGVHVDIPASGIAELGVRAELIMRDLRSLGASASRIDIAGDDFTGVLDLDKVIDHARQKTFVTRARQDAEGGRWTISENEHGGRTVYFGKRSSDTFLRIYDKRIEQLDKHKPVEHDHWVRGELELKAERAAAAFEYICLHPDDWQEAACGWIRSHLDFKEVGESEQKTRWPVCDWWLAFLDQAAKSCLYVVKAQKTIDDVRRWVDRQVSPSLFVLKKALGIDELIHMILSAEDRLSLNHEMMLSAAGVST